MYAHIHVHVCVCACVYVIVYVYVCMYVCNAKVRRLLSSVVGSFPQFQREGGQAWATRAVWKVGRVCWGLGGTWCRPLGSCFFSAIGPKTPQSKNPIETRSLDLTPSPCARARCAKPRAWRAPARQRLPRSWARTQPAARFLNLLPSKISIRDGDYLLNGMVVS